MSLRDLDLPTPTDLNHRWAAEAAIWNARGWDDVRAEGPVRHHGDGGGNWASMVLLPEGRALLFGQDHEYSQTFAGETAQEFGVEPTDILAGAPAWWGEALEQHFNQEFGPWVAFAYGWEDGRWQRAEYAAEDGFEELELPFLSHDDTVASLVDFLDTTALDEQLEAEVDQEAVDALVQAGPAVTEEQLAAVAFSGWDVAKGVAAARAFVL
ncbi:proteophosphoglycan 5 [Janibacter anophelis]|uniref:proteophosphoglycan 5 n=1 Tax=Janibacter anophelis TaxID=319054 RepID=UPI000AE31528|nr:proteophosphoglycan 5 [Janibacter anophelis]